MRADRLVAILLVMQARGRVTARELATELEVSLKTARRDLEALAVAGIPVYSQPGRGGGWLLLGGARTDLSGLTAGEARALFLVAPSGSSLTPAAKTALRKLVRALPETFRADAEKAASAVVLDPVRWGESAPEAVAHLEVLQHAVIDRRRVRLQYVDRERRLTDRVVHPLGLVEKGSAWYLIAGTEGGRRSFRLSRIHSVTVTDEPADRPEGFDLAAAWREDAAAIEQHRRKVTAIVRAGADALPGLRAQFGTDLTLVEPAEADHADAEPRVSGSIRVEIGAPTAEMVAEQLAGWGRLLEVVGPPAVRAHLARIGAELVDRYAPSSPSA